MPSLFSKDENLRKSAPYVGFEILKQLQKNESGRISIFDIARNFQKTNKLGVRSIYFGMIFLYSLNIIDFEAPYVIKNVKS